MSDCGCKDGTKGTPKEMDMATSFGGSFFVRIIIFLFAVAVVGFAMIPIILPLMLIMLYNRIVRQKDTDVTKGLLKIGKLLRTSKKRKDDEDDDEDEDINGEDINPDDYELVDVDVIK